MITISFSCIGVESRSTYSSENNIDNIEHLESEQHGQGLQQEKRIAMCLDGQCMFNLVCIPCGQVPSSPSPNDK